MVCWPRMEKHQRKSITGLLVVDRYAVSFCFWQTYNGRRRSKQLKTLSGKMRLCHIPHLMCYPEMSLAPFFFFCPIISFNLHGVKLHEDVIAPSPVPYPPFCSNRVGNGDEQISG